MEADTEGDGLTVNVKMLDSTVHQVRVPSADVGVGTLQTQVAEVTGVPVDRQRLIFRGAVLREDRSLASYRIEDGVVVHLVVKPETNGGSGSAAPAAQPSQPARPAEAPNRPQGQQASVVLQAMIPQGATRSHYVQGIVMQVLQTLGVPRNTAHRGAAAAVQATLRERGRSELIEDALSDLNPLLERLGHEQVGSLPEGSAAAMPELLRAFATVAQGVAERANTVAESLPSTETQQDRPEQEAREQVLSMVDDLERLRGTCGALSVLASTFGEETQGATRGEEQNPQVGASGNTVPQGQASEGTEQQRADPTQDPSNVINSVVTGFTPLINNIVSMVVQASQQGGAPDARTAQQRGPPAGQAAEERTEGGSGGPESQPQAAPPAVETGGTGAAAGQQPAFQMPNNAGVDPTQVMNTMTPIIHNIFRGVMEQMQRGRPAGGANAAPGATAAGGNQANNPDGQVRWRVNVRQVPAGTGHQHQRTAGANANAPSTGNTTSQTSSSPGHRHHHHHHPHHHHHHHRHPASLLQRSSHHRHAHHHHHHRSTSQPHSSADPAAAPASGAAGGGAAPPSARENPPVVSPAPAPASATTPASATAPAAPAAPAAPEGAPQAARESPPEASPATPAANGGTEVQSEYADVFGRLLEAVSSAVQGQNNQAPGPAPSLGHLMRDAMEGTSLNDTEEESDLDRLLTVAMEHVDISELMGVLNGNLDVFGSIRQPVRRYCLDNFTDGDASTDAADGLTDRLMSTEVDRFLADIDTLPVMVERRRDDAPTARETLKPIVDRQFRTLVRAVLDDVGHPDATFPTFTRGWIDETVGELCYELSMLMRNGWPDALAVVRVLAATRGTQLYGQELGMMIAMGGNLLLRYATDSRSRWIQRISAEGGVAVNPPAEQAAPPSTDCSAVPGAPDVPTAPSAPNAPNAPNAPSTRNAPDAPDTPVHTPRTLELAGATVAEPPNQQQDADAAEPDLDALLDEVTAEMAPAAMAPAAPPREDEASVEPGADGGEPDLDALLDEVTAEMESEPAVAGRDEAAELADGAAEAAVEDLDMDELADRVAEEAAAEVVGEAQKGDVFDQFLSSEDAQRWRSMIKSDADKQKGQRKKPMSRAYRSGGAAKLPPPPEPLTDVSAAGMAGASMRRAARDAGCSDETISSATAELSASQAGKRYNLQLQDALSSRLSNDTDFDPKKFPNAARRFGGS